MPISDDISLKWTIELERKAKTYNVHIIIYRETKYYAKLYCV